MRILLAGMTNMLSQLVSEIVTHSDHVLVGRIDAADDLPATILSTRTDILLIQTKDFAKGEALWPLLYNFPTLTIVTIAASGQDGFVHELRPYAFPLGEMSADVLTAFFDSKLRGTPH